MTYIWLLIIFCIIEYVMNKTLNPNTRALYLHLHNEGLPFSAIKQATATKEIPATVRSEVLVMVA